MENNVRDIIDNIMNKIAIAIDNSAWWPVYGDIETYILKKYGHCKAIGKIVVEEKPVYENWDDCGCCGIRESKYRIKDERGSLFSIRIRVEWCMGDLNDVSAIGLEKG